MKRHNFTFIILATISFFVSAQDTMYIHKADTILKIATNEIDSIIFYAIEDNNDITYGSVTDIDNNIYKTVVIGTQEWMAENLAVTQYADGTSIENKTGNSAWAALGDNNIDKAYCWYNDEIANKDVYGALYTYAAATNGTPHNGTDHAQGVCPTGWHLPSDAEWTQLEYYLADNGYNYDGTRGSGRRLIAKALASQSGWSSSPDLGGLGYHLGDIGFHSETNNRSGFSARPGGYCSDYDGAFFNAGSYGYWWSSTESNSARAYRRRLSYDYEGVYRYNGLFKSCGYSVRCVRD